MESPDMALQGESSYGLATNEEKQENLRAGKHLMFTPAPLVGLETLKSRAARTIQASWLQEMATLPARNFQVPISISNAIIEGKLQLSFANFEHEFAIINSEFTGEVDFSGAMFKRVANLSGSVFQKQCDVKAVHCNFDLEFERSYFNDEADFFGLTVDGSLNASGATFGKKVIFERINVLNMLRFQPMYNEDDPIPVRFKGEARFADSHIHGNAIFNCAQFEGKAKFDQIQVDGAAFFRPSRFEYSKPIDNPLPVLFKDEVSFRNAQIQGNALFDCAQFEGAASFHLFHVGGVTVFHTNPQLSKVIPTRFKGKALFLGAHFNNFAFFDGVQFGDVANFNQIKADSSIFFRPVYFDSIVNSDENVLAVSFKGEISFLGAKILGDVEFDGAQFEDKANFERVQIGGVALFRTNLVGNKVKVTCFKNEVNFGSASIVGSADFAAVQFHKSAEFNLMRVGGAIKFRTMFYADEVYHTCFSGRVGFVSARIQSFADFDGAQFEAEADFSRFQVGEAAFFRIARFNGERLSNTEKNVPVVFKGKVHFVNAHINNNVVFDGAQFESEANFGQLQVDGNALFRIDRVDAIGIQLESPPQVTSFHKNVSFLNAKIRGNAEFDGAQFIGEASFEGIQVGGTAIFRSVSFGNKIFYTRFRGSVRFLDAQLDRGIDFSGTQFNNIANFQRIRVNGDGFFRNIRLADISISTTFDAQAFFGGAQFKSQLNFQGAIFNGPSDFSRTQVNGTALFLEAVFKDSVSFREAQFHIVLFRENITENDLDRNIQFTKSVDIFGFHYDRINVAWRELLTAISSYDREVYTQLEKVFQLSGYDREADDVYLERRKREAQRMWDRVFRRQAAKTSSLKQALREVPPALYDLVQRITTNYGIRPYRLLITSLLIFLLGAFIFSQSNAVVNKASSQGSYEITQDVLEPSSSWDEPIKLGTAQAMGVSLELLTSTAKIPIASQYEPSDNAMLTLGQLTISYADYAQFHRFAGIILIPLGLAILSGKLGRRAKK